jgi:hypothetical protein
MNCLLKKGRFLSIERSELWVCTLCNKHKGYEFHYLFYCTRTHFTQARCRFLPKQSTDLDYPNTITYSTLMNCNNRFTIVGLAKIKIVMSMFKWCFSYLLCLIIFVQHCFFFDNILFCTTCIMLHVEPHSENESLKSFM